MVEIEQFFSVGRDQFARVLSYPVDSTQRIFWLYLLTSALAAYFVYRRIRSRAEHATEMDREAASGSFLHFLFPKRVWSHPSAWLDLRYAFFHKIISGAAVIAFLATGFAWGYSLTGPSLDAIAERPEASGALYWIAPLAFMLVVFLVTDFTGWFVHMLQHKSRFLWQFHKVHHSAEVMHPISNYREHPIDNLTYGASIGFMNGAAVGAVVSWLDYVPNTPTVLGVPVLMFLFNIVAYNLRHSHVWLRWSGRWSAVFPSPAHHHVHHSMHPDHIDKNFAFMFPFWDVIFGTYAMPEDNRDVKFGVPEYDRKGLDSVLGLYLVPFRDAFNVLRNKGPGPAKKPTASSGEPAMPQAKVSTVKRSSPPGS